MDSNDSEKPQDNIENQNQDEIQEEVFDTSKLTSSLELISALVNYAEELMFPPIKTGVVTPLDQTEWSKIRRILYKISSPFPTSIALDSAKALILLCWAVVSLLWYVMAQVMMDIIFSTSPASGSEESFSLIVNIIGYSLMVVVLGAIPVSYWSWIEFFRDKRYKPWLRIILTVVFIGIVVSSPFWLLLPENLAKLPSVVWADARHCSLFILSYVLLLIPLGTFWYRFLVSALPLAWGLILGWIKYIEASLTPISTDDISNLSLASIKYESLGEEREVRMVDLSELEIKMVQEFASSNRESSDKKLIPTAVFFGLLGVFANTKVFTTSINNALEWLVNTVRLSQSYSEGMSSLAWTGNYFAALIIVAIVGGFLLRLLVLIKNLIVQSLILETSIVVLYSCKYETE